MNFSFPGLKEIAILVFFAAGIYFSFRKDYKNIFFVIQALIFLLFLLVSIKPSFISYEKNTKPKISLLVDNSSSMKYANRLAKVKSIIKNNYGYLSSNFNPSIYTFSSNINKIDIGKLERVKPDGNSTDIANSLEQLFNSEKNTLDAVILFSDGRHNGAGRAQEITDMLAESSAGKTPVFTVYPEDEKKLADISISDLKVSDYAYKNVPVELEITVSVFGIEPGREINIFLKKDNEIIVSKSAKAEAGSFGLSMKFTPSKLGAQTYSVEIPPYSGETITSNNSRVFTIDVIREKIRILYICGQPNPEYYYLRYLLKNDPSIELVSFVILRNPENIAIVPDEKLSLIPFPVNEIFAGDLFKYDILVLENFNPSRFAVIYEYIDNIARFVREKAGGLLVIGGDNSFGKGSYSGLESVLPVLMDKPDEPIEEGLFAIRILDFSNPMVKLSDDSRENQKIWQELPELDACQKLRPKPGTDIIAVHPWSKTESGNNTVVLAAGEYGKGRSVAMGCNTTWRWALGTAEKGLSSEYFSKFWKNVFNWLSQSEETKNFRISIPQKKYLAGDEIDARLIILDENFRNCTPELTVTDPFMKKNAVTRLYPDKSGWKTKYLPVSGGKYRFDAKLYRGGSAVKADTKEITVSENITAEDLDVQVNPALMKDIAFASSGRAFAEKDFAFDKISPLVNKNVHPAVRKQTLLSNEPFFYLFVILLFFIRWVISRLRGLI